MSNNQQRRMFMVTVNPGHVRSDWKKPDGAGDDWHTVIPADELQGAYRQWWSALGEYPNVQYRKGQIEIGDGGLMHIQCVIKFSKSVRPSTLRKRLGGHFEPANNWVACRRYVEKTSDRFEFLGEDGEAPDGTGRTEGYGSAKQRAIQALRDGLTPQEIAQSDPEAYFTHHRSIEALWEKLHIDPNART